MLLSELLFATVELKKDLNNYAARLANGSDSLIQKCKFARLQCSLLVILGVLNFSVQASSVESYAKFNDFGKMRISPDGKYLAVIANKENRRVVVVLVTDTLKASHVVFFKGSNDQVGNFSWVSKQRLLVEVSRFFPSEMERPFGGGELFAVDADGAKPKRIFTYDLPTNARKRRNSGIGFGGFASLIDPLESEEKHALIKACSFTGEVCSFFKINLFNGSLKGKQKLPPRSHSFVLDDDKQPRYAMTETEFNERKIFGRLNDKWTLLGSFPYPGGMIRPMSISGDGSFVYAVDDREGGPEIVVKADRNLKNISAKLYQHRLTNILDYHSDADNKIYALEAGLGRPELVILESENESVQHLSALRLLFPEKVVKIVDQAKDGSLQLIAVSSDKIPPEYYLYNVDTKSLKFLLSQRPWVKESESVATKVLEFQSRDNLTITALLTMPSYKSGTKAPLIVNPHGGPHGPFDNWEYDPQAQFLASLGFAVLKVNFRGSGGFGAEFEAAGFRQWGREIQYDIIDATRHVISLGHIDAERVGIMGGSFGGYSALQSSILAPSLFKAAVGVVGVYDFKLMYSSGDIRGRFSGRRYLEKALGKDDVEFKEFSPVTRVKELKAPVLLIQGEKDERAPVKHSDLMASRLAELGHPHSYVVMPNEGHGFYKLENRVRHFELISEFFVKELGLNDMKSVY
jgi:acetyl esterase/lipase